MPGQDRRIPLRSQEDFEKDLYSSELKTPILLHFTASWCGPCQRIDWQFILDEFPTLPVYKCDVDENKYTAGFCGVRSIPSMLLLFPGKRIVGPIQASETGKIATWIFTSLKTPAK
jgi:thioredoxin-like negative regulator of GroEL